MLTSSYLKVITIIPLRADDSEQNSRSGYGDARGRSVPYTQGDGPSTNAVRTTTDANVDTTNAKENNMTLLKAIVRPGRGWTP